MSGLLCCHHTVVGHFTKFISKTVLQLYSFAVSAHNILTSEQPAPLQLPLSVLNITIVTLSINLPKCQLKRLQQIQNSLARFVVKAPKSTHITPILKYLQRTHYTKFLQPA